MISYPPPEQNPFFWDADEDVEKTKRYTTGGYCPVILGDTFKSDVASYRVLHKLGHGSFATVWLAGALGAGDFSHRFVALKICVANADPYHELAVHNRLPNEPERHVIQALDHFSRRSPNGTHSIFVHDVLGSLVDLSDLVQRQIRQVCKQIVQGIAFLHRHGVIHGDLHAANVGVCLPTLKGHSEEDILDYFGCPGVTPVLPHQACARADALPAYLVPPISLASYLKDEDPAFAKRPLRVEIMDLGGAALAGEEPRSSCTPAAVSAPELMFKKVINEVDPPATFASDIWSLACTLYGIGLRGSTLFYWATPSVALLGQMATLCGEAPLQWRAHSEVGKYLETLDSTISPEVAEAKWQERFKGLAKIGGWEKEDVAGFSELLRMMLKMDPSARPSAEEILHHPWLAVE